MKEALITEVLSWFPPKMVALDPHHPLLYRPAYISRNFGEPSRRQQGITLTTKSNTFLILTFNNHTVHTLPDSWVSLLYLVLFTSSSNSKKLFWRQTKRQQQIIRRNFSSRLSQPLYRSPRTKPMAISGKFAPDCKLRQVQQFWGHFWNAVPFSILISTKKNNTFCSETVFKLLFFKAKTSNLYLKSWWRERAFSMRRYHRC